MRDDTVIGGAEQAALVVGVESVTTPAVLLDPTEWDGKPCESIAGQPGLGFTAESVTGSEPWEWVPWEQTPGGGHHG